MLFFSLLSLSNTLTVTYCWPDFFLFSSTPILFTPFTLFWFLHIYIDFCLPLNLSFYIEFLFLFIYVELLHWLHSPLLSLIFNIFKINKRFQICFILGSFMTFNPVCSLKLISFCLYDWNCFFFCMPVCENIIVCSLKLISFCFNDCNSFVCLFVKKSLLSL